MARRARLSRSRAVLRLMTQEPRSERVQKCVKPSISRSNNRRKLSDPPKPDIAQAPGAAAWYAGRSSSAAPTRPVCRRTSSPPTWRWRASARRWAQAAFLAAARSIMGVLARRRRLHALIAEIEAPTLIIQGTEDRLVPLAASRATAALRRDWSLAVFDGVGHVPQLEAPERFVETVVAWL